MEIKATSLSQEELKSKAVMFCEDFGEVDKKTISKIVEDFEKEHKRVVANVSNSIFEEMGGQEGKRRGRKKGCAAKDLLSGGRKSAEYDPKCHYSSIEMSSVQCYPVQQS